MAPTKNVFSDHCIKCYILLYNSTKELSIQNTLFHQGNPLFAPIVTALFFTASAEFRNLVGEPLKSMRLRGSRICPRRKKEHPRGCSFIGSNGVILLEIAGVDGKILARGKLGNSLPARSELLGEMDADVFKGKSLRAVCKKKIFSFFYYGVFVHRNSCRKVYRFHIGKADV